MRKSTTTTVETCDNCLKENKIENDGVFSDIFRYIEPLKVENRPKWFFLRFGDGSEWKDYCSADCLREAVANMTK